MLATSSTPDGHDDGFSRIPAKPRQAYLFVAHPMLYHLPTKLATKKRDIWRLPRAVEDMSSDDVVVLWQDEPHAGIYGIALPYGEPFESTYPPVRGNESRYQRCGTLSIKLQYIYVLAKPLLATTIESRNEHARARLGLLGGRFRDGEILSLGADLRKGNGYRLSPKQWKSIYECLTDNRDTAIGITATARAVTKFDANPSIDSEDCMAEDFPIAPVMSNSSDLEYIARQVWMFLAQAAEANSLVHPSILSEKLNVPPAQIRDCLDLIDSVCKSENWPSLTSVVQPIDLHGDIRDSKVVSIARFHSDVHAENSFTSRIDWKLMPNPFDFVLRATTDQLVQRLVENPSPDESSAVYRLVKIRGSAQVVFARMMRRIYDNQCAFCGFSVAPALEAAHIKPWPMCLPSERLLPSNGLLLCAVHHKLFDAGLISLDKWNIIRVFSPRSMTYIAKADDQYVLDLNGSLAHMPIDLNLRPSPEFLEFRRELVAQMFER